VKRTSVAYEYGQKVLSLDIFVYIFWRKNVTGFSSRLLLRSAVTAFTIED